MPARVFCVFSSNAARISAGDVFSGTFGGIAARSKDDAFRMVAPQTGRLEMCVARPPSDIDLPWGLHASRSTSAGSRSSSRRVVATS